MSQYHSTKSETFKAKCTHRITTSNILASIMKIKWGEKNPHKILWTILAKSFSVYMNGVMETNWSKWSVAVLCLSDVFFCGGIERTSLYS